ncbi:MAG: pyrroline-5-carboxylate reductase [Clostridia bacterium]|nr:pyrroline-5-carboxylate reductase [Clostridia bacterium]
MQYQIGFIGCGNMGGALARAVCKAIDGKNVAVCDYDVTKTDKLQQQFGATPLSILDLVQSCKFIVLGVKPQNMQETTAQMKEVLRLRNDAVIITMAAGVSTSAIRAYLGDDLPVIRIMPNTPAELGQGMILYTVLGASQADEQAFLQCFAKAGKIDKIPEDKIDAASALSGCGPAFVYAFAEALADAGVECGVPRDKANLYTAQTLLGAAEMLLTFGHPADLKDAVCSPGGTTIAGIHALEDAGFRGAVMDAVTAAYKRTLELKK